MDGNSTMIRVHGEGEMEITAGASIENEKDINAITVHNDITLTVNSGNVKSGNFHTIMAADDATVIINGGTVENNAIAMETVFLAVNSALAVHGGTVINHTSATDVICAIDSTTVYVTGGNIVANSIDKYSIATAYYIGNHAAKFTSNFTPNVDLFRLDSYIPPLITENELVYSYNDDIPYEGKLTMTAPLFLSGFIFGEIKAVNGITDGYTISDDGKTVTFAGTYKTGASGLTLTVTGTLADGRIPVEFNTASFGVNILFLDNTPPTAMVRHTNATNNLDYRDFLGNSVNIFYRDYVNVEIMAEDDVNGSGVAKLEYFLSEMKLEFKDSGGLGLPYYVEDIPNWEEANSNDYASFSKLYEPGVFSRFVLYVKVTDNAGNVAYYEDCNTVVFLDSQETADGGMFRKGEDGDVTVPVDMHLNQIKEITLNGDVVDKDNYEDAIDEITFKSEYLETLDNGEHKFTATYYPQGYRAIMSDGYGGDTIGTTEITIVISKHYCFCCFANMCDKYECDCSDVGNCMSCDCFPPNGWCHVCNTTGTLVGCPAGDNCPHLWCPEWYGEGDCNNPSGSEYCNGDCTPFEEYHHVCKDCDILWECSVPHPGKGFTGNCRHCNQFAYVCECCKYDQCDLSGCKCDVGGVCNKNCDCRLPLDFCNYDCYVITETRHCDGGDNCVHYYCPKNYYAGECTNTGYCFGDCTKVDFNHHFCTGCDIWYDCWVYTDGNCFGCGEYVFECFCCEFGICGDFDCQCELGICDLNCGCERPDKWCNFCHSETTWTFCIDFDNCASAYYYCPAAMRDGDCLKDGKFACNGCVSWHDIHHNCNDCGSYGYCDTYRADGSPDNGHCAFCGEFVYVCDWCRYGLCEKAGCKCVPEENCLLKCGGKLPDWCGYCEDETSFTLCGGGADCKHFYCPEYYGGDCNSPFRSCNFKCTVIGADFIHGSCDECDRWVEHYDGNYDGECDWCGVDLCVDCGQPAEYCICPDVCDDCGKNPCECGEYGGIIIISDINDVELLESLKPGDVVVTEDGEEFTIGDGTDGTITLGDLTLYVNRIGDVANSVEELFTGIMGWLTR